MTAHNRGEKGDYAPVVLCPGDPLRAKMVAQQYMEDARLVTDVRGILGYTGLYHGSPVSVLATGMGEGSIGIYSYELYTFYDVKAIIRIGTCGGLLASVGVGDIVAAMSASTDGGYAGQYRLSGTFNPCADYPMLETAMRIAGEDTFRSMPEWCFPANTSLPIMREEPIAGSVGREWAHSLRTWKPMPCTATRRGRAKRLFLSLL